MKSPEEASKTLNSMFFLICALMTLGFVLPPLILLLMGCFGFLFGEFWMTLISIPMLGVLLLAFFDDGRPLFKRKKRQQPPPKLSKWEEQKKAESLYKFP